ncbi:MULTISPECIES: hypothetical protein [unclassified Mycolicibacterium]|uniref:hypothetical protein n=1 Tax=unclassified Mycolicibacterium TaxID=2636767 RepID=UPI001F4C2F15|nr:hypothetical protein [Mycolicibacterium sp. YH-1]UNB54389.1 hypothetical protein L0M16_08725 [Mycolicibacterium sp. YH-1]
MTNTVRVGSLDLAMAGDPVWVVAGPVADDVECQFTDVLARMAANGPRLRVGLIPATSGRLWECTDKPGALLKADLAGARTPEQILERVLGRPAPAPISLVQVGAYVCVCFDHGIGDSHVMMEMLAAITARNAPRGFVEPVPNPALIDRPLRTALVTFARNSEHRGPLTLEFAQSTFTAVVHKARKMFHNFKTQHGHTATVRGYEAIHVVSKPGFVRDVRAWRDARHAGASLTSVVIFSIHRALRAAGIPVADDVDVLIDLRRRLPRGVETLANLCTITKVAAGRNMTFDEFSDQFRVRTSSGWPLVKTAAHLGLGRIALALGVRPSPKWWLVGTPAESGLVEVTYSDISKIPSTSKLDFTRPEAGVLAVALPPGTTRSLTIALWVSAAGQVQVTATQPPGLIDRDTLRRALETALNPAVVACDRSDPRSDIVEAIAL